MMQVLVPVIELLNWYMLLRFLTRIIYVMLKGLTFYDSQQLR